MAENIVVDGYNLLAEKNRETFPPQTLCGRTLRRDQALLVAEGRLLADPLPADTDPAIELSYPSSGMFVDSPTGLYMDLSQGMAWKLVDEQHPLIQQALSTLTEHKGTDHKPTDRRDRSTHDDTEGPHTPQELARLISRLTVEGLPQMDACQTVFSSTGLEAGEVGLKLARLSASRRFVAAHGSDVLARLMADLDMARDVSPFFLVGCDNALHGTARSPWVAHVPFNGELDVFEELFDERTITDILEAPGGVRKVIDQGRIPAGLFAGIVVEANQREGGSPIASREWFHRIAEATRRRGALVCVNEVQTLGRTGQLYAVEHTDVTPDILWTASTALLGITVARQELVKAASPEWRDGTIASGTALEVNMAWATFILLTQHKEPAFEGRTMLENSRIKGEYVRMGLAELSAAHTDILPSFTGLGGLWELRVAHREEVIATAWRMGLRLLGCGPAGETSRIRLVFLVDVLTHEIDQVMAALQRVFAVVEDNHPDE